MEEENSNHEGRKGFACDRQMICRFAVWITAALCSYPLGVGAGGYLLLPWPSLQREFLSFGLVTGVLIILGCFGWIIAARMEYWREFPMWRLLGWLALSAAGGVALLGPSF